MLQEIGPRDISSDFEEPVPTFTHSTSEAGYVLSFSPVPHTLPAV